MRGTPQQIIDKYQQLTRDAQLGNDRVAAENFQQHAEHYTRLLGEAQREAEAKRAEHEAQQRERQAQRDAERAEREERKTKQKSENPAEPAASDGLATDGADSSTLVETPETAQKRQGRSRSKPAPAPVEAQPDVQADTPPEAPKAAE